MIINKIPLDFEMLAGPGVSIKTGFCDEQFCKNNLSD